MYCLGLDLEYEGIPNGSCVMAIKFQPRGSPLETEPVCFAADTSYNLEPLNLAGTVIMHSR